MPKKKDEDEKQFAEAQKLIAQTIAKWFHETLDNLEHFSQMKQLVTIIYEDDDAALSMLGAIQLWENEYDWPWQCPEIISVFDIVSRLQFKKFREQKLNLTQTGLSTPLEELIDRRIRMGMKEGYFYLGVAPDGAGLVTGPKGAGKSSFIANEFIIPALEDSKTLVVHNMNLIDPVEQKMEDMLNDYIIPFNFYPFLNMELNTNDIDYEPINLIDLSEAKFNESIDSELLLALKHIDNNKINVIDTDIEDVGFKYWEIELENKNAVKLKGRCYYASSIDDALRAIVKHALKGILETGKPYLSVWIVDEAGISRGKQRSMENRLLFHKYITLLSRKLGCFELSIYQLDDAPKELEVFSTHKFHKPSRKRKDYVNSYIDSGDYIEDAYVKGVLDWDMRKKLGMKYIEFGTYDIATMVSSFDIRALLDDVNQITTGGKPVKTKVQFERILAFIDRAQSRVSEILDRDEILIFILRIQEHYKLSYQYLNIKPKLTPEQKIERDRYKWLKSDQTAVDIVKAELPLEKWYVQNLRDEFKRIKRIYPECLKWESLPDDTTIRDMAGAITTGIENAFHNVLDDLEDEAEV